MQSLPELKRHHAKRLREVYRSAGWPSLDVIEIELLAAGLLERHSLDNHAHVRVTDAGIQYLASAAHSNRQAMSAHEALVDQGIAVFDPQTAPPARRRVLILHFGSG